MKYYIERRNFKKFKKKSLMPEKIGYRVRKRETKEIRVDGSTSKSHTHTLHNHTKFLYIHINIFNI